MKKALFTFVSLVFLPGISFAGMVAPAPISTPTFTPWGMVGTAAGLGVMGIYFIFRRNK